MQAFILAGGFATRLWPLTEKRAKPLLPLAGKPLLTYLVEKIPRAMPITVSTNQVFAKDFESWRNNMLRQAQHDVSILIEDAGHEDEKLGALGALAKWLEEEKIEDDILLLAGDNYIGFLLETFLRAYETGIPLIAAKDIGDREKAKCLGTVILEGKKIRSFEEKPANPRSTFVSAGCFILPATTLSVLLKFAKKHPDNIGGIFEHFLHEGIAVQGNIFTEPWFDIGSFEAYLEATKALVGQKLLLGERAMCNATMCNGCVVLGRDSNVSRCRLQNVVAFDDCTIDDCILENCVIDNGCTLKGVDLTGKMLRERTILIRR